MLHLGARLSEVGRGRVPITLTICRFESHGLTDDEQALVAVGQQTLIRVGD